MTGLGKFRVFKWRWYLVDERNWYHPVLVRKHFESRKQAERFRDKYCDKSYEAILGKVALMMELSDWHNYKKKHRHEVAKYSKYDFPPNIITQRQKQIFRQSKRLKLKSKSMLPKLSYRILKEILDGKEILFLKRLKNHRSIFTAYSRPVKGFFRYKEEYIYPVHVERLSIIYWVLTNYYDCGLYDPVDVTIYTYEILQERVIKWLSFPDISRKDEDDVKDEFLARGFIKKRDSNFITGEDAFVESILIRPTLVYPEQAWHDKDHIGLYDHNVYQLQSLVGIRGYTRASIVEYKP